MMMMFAVKAREPEAKPDLLTDVDVANRLGIHKATVWKLLDVKLIPDPKKIGVVKMADGRQRSRMTRWSRKDIELFVECSSMAEFNRRRQSK